MNKRKPIAIVLTVLWTLGVLALSFLDKAPILLWYLGVPMLYWGWLYIKSYSTNTHISKSDMTMSNITLPVAIIIGAALIAGAMLITSGVYEFKSQEIEVVHRYNKLTGSIYICVIGKPCVPMKEFR